MAATPDRFAAVADIHGNLPALEAVIDDIARAGVDQVVALGDHLSGPLWPVETAERLMALGWPALAGNHERQLLEWPIARMGKTDAFAASRLTPAIRDWMASLPGTMRLSPDVLLCHGTPTDDNTYWLHRGRRGAMREASHDEIAHHATRAMLTLCGHTHLARVVRMNDRRLIANAGSVGLPAYEDHLPRYQDVDTDQPLARYLIATRDADGWHVELRAVAYDHENAARKAESEGRANWAEALRTGMVR